MRSKKIYCVGNAHLDPVWMWRWQEGSCEAKATIRSALDRMKEYPEFVFVCAAGQVFKWIEAFDPDMFDEIRRRVKEGRFVITGGWFVQPDCNLPSGESFVRHGLYTQRYFKENFGVTAKVGYNVDSFGHNAMLPQILKKTGMNDYVFMRPGIHEKTLPSNIFRWISPDGSEVIAARLQVQYNFSNSLTSEEGLQNTVNRIEAETDPDSDQIFMFYGVGNHGGGPTKQSIETILSYRKKHPETEFIFSNVKDFFDRARLNSEKLPVVKDDLQHHASGCYSAVSQIKTQVRRAECALYAAENYGMLALHLLGRANPTTDEIQAAWENVMFAHFHDSLGGCSVKKVYEDAEIMLGQSRAAAAKMENTALQSLSWKIDTSDASKGVPMIVFNPHPFEAEQMITVNSRFCHIFDEKGVEVPSQVVHSPTVLCRDPYGDTVFTAKIPPLGYKTYYMNNNSAGQNQTFISENAPKAEGMILENEFLRVEFEEHTGYIKSILDKKTNRQMLSGYGAVPVVIDEYGHDTWSHAKNFFDKEIARFTDPQITVLESGPVRARIKVTNRYNSSALTQYFTLLSGSDQLLTECRLDWHERHKMLKIRYQTALSEPKAYYEIPYGVFERPADGEEEPGLMWIAAKDKTNGFALLNDCKYSFSIRGNNMELTAIRSPFYNDHGRIIEDVSECEYTDQGESEFRYAFRALPEDGWSSAIKAAKLLNIPCTAIMENNHSGTLPESGSHIKTAEDNIIISALKRSEDSGGIILRAYETDGKATVAHITGSLLSVPLTAEFTPYSINTYYLADGSLSWKEVMMTEFPFSD
ncbi:MAG: alpha-mannosidase [Oscillospiraceae bacterium]|nr:alpha-mannosidase [Oscillospiraceae bacterium]